MDDAGLGDLVAAAQQARGSAYAPYSGFAVGAAISADGRTFVGVNVENVSYPVSQCAERNAIAAMVAGGARHPEAIAIVSEAKGPTPPCGACRQALAEFGGAAMTVVAHTLAGAHAAWSLGELLPSPFGPGSP